MTFDPSSSQTNTDSGLNIARDFQTKQSGDVILDEVMAEIARRLELQIFEAGFLQAISAVIDDRIDGLNIPENAIGISGEATNILNADPNGDVILEPKDVPSPLAQTKEGIIGNPAVSPVTVTWDTAFPNNSYHLSAYLTNQIDGNGAWWIAKYADRVEISFVNITANAAVTLHARATENVNP